MDIYLSFFRENEIDLVLVTCWLGAYVVGVLGIGGLLKLLRVFEL